MKRTLPILFSDAKSIARRRGLVFAIGREDYYRLRSSGCHYCTGRLADTGIGLDRIDSNVGYILANVVPCCNDCNRTKGASFTYAEMLILGKAIAAVKACRKDGEEPDHFRRRLRVAEEA